MFNKPTANTREDAIPRNDTRNFLNPGAPAATQPVAELATKAAPQADSRSPAPVIASPAPLGQQSAAENKTSEARLIVGPDVKLKGAEILDCDTLVVEGRVEATMDSRKTKCRCNAMSG